MTYKKALIIGYGSIGRLHANLLKDTKLFKDIYVFTSQKLTKFKKIKKLSEIKFIEPDYIVIASNTSLHFSYLNYLNKNLKNKIILVEKPLFNKHITFFKQYNKIYVGYDLRYNPTILLIKNLLKKEKIWSINIICGSYLPEWRKNISYAKSYSAKKSLGGGVLLDLSHEIDYLNWIFGSINPKFVFSKKISNLKISSDDTLHLIGNIKKIVLNLSLNYYTRKPIRQIIIDGNNISITADIINNEIFYKLNNKSYYKKYHNINRQYTYNNMHKSILLDRKPKNICTINEGIKVMKQIHKIRELE